MPATFAIAFRNMESSPSLEAQVRRRAEELEQFSDRITACRVTLEAAHRRHRQGTIYRVSVDLTVPGGNVVVNREPGEDHAHEDMHVAVIRHPMPYGDLAAQRAQRFASPADLDAAHCTLEEREEYEQHVARGNVVFAGVDYAAILQMAEAEADIIIWDGGNNDFPFIRPDLHIAIADALRPDQVATHHPGETVARMADVLVVNKSDAAPPADVTALTARLRAINPRATIIRGTMPVTLDDAAAVRGRRVLVIEDGPTLTHGGMPYGAGTVAALIAGASDLVDPRPAASPELLRVFADYPHIGKVLPAVGYSEPQLRALSATIECSGADVVVAATPIDLAALITVSKPIVRVRYEFVEDEAKPLSAIVDEFLRAQVKT